MQNTTSRVAKTKRVEFGTVAVQVAVTVAVAVAVAVACTVELRSPEARARAPCRRRKAPVSCTVHSAAGCRVLTNCAGKHRRWKGPAAGKEHQAGSKQAPGRAERAAFPLSSGLDCSRLLRVSLAHPLTRAERAEDHRREGWRGWTGRQIRSDHAAWKQASLRPVGWSAGLPRGRADRPKSNLPSQIS